MGMLDVINEIFENSIAGIQTYAGPAVGGSQFIDNSKYPDYLEYEEDEKS